MNIENIARTRAIRLKKAGINNQAVAAFQSALKAAKESGLDTEGRRRIREEAAREFIALEESTLSGINRKFKRSFSAADGNFKDLLKGRKLTPAEKSKWIDGTENQKTSILASHYLSSENIQAVYDVAINNSDGIDIDAIFYNMLKDVIQTAYNNPGYNALDLNSYIIGLYDT